ncbi:MAG: methionine biosynthesis protein MetW [Fimbriimonadaceae bacterium]|nr:methionine biosynthesis protein MetW [Fimbriimonadaceae bacterium]
MADRTHRETIERLYATHPQLSEAVAFLASLDTHFGDDPGNGRVRWDHDLIVSLIPSGAKVLDLGCGEGDLLSRLIHEHGCHGQGVERDEASIIRCVERGVPVIQSDLDQALPGFPQQSFDYVVLEETLQTVSRPQIVLDEMLRIGCTGIVSFPNFGHWWIRTQLLIEGRMPVTPRLPQSWYGTPNIHVLTVRDFTTWCQTNGVAIQQQFAYAEGEYHELIPADNTLAEEALFVIERAR